VQVLSYFHGEMLKVGAVVEIDFNHRKIRGVAVVSEPLKSRKLDFKKSVDFELKNISKVISAEPMVSERQLTIANWLSNYYYAPLGICLKTILPPFWNKKGYKNETPKNTLSVKQTFLMVAENIAGKYFMEKYASEKPVYISSGLKNKEYFDVWNKVAAGESKLIIGTRIGLFLPFSNLSKMIVDDGSNEAYKSDMTPRYNAVDLARFVANVHNSEVISSDVFPRIEFPKSASSVVVRKSPVDRSVVNMISEIKAGNFSIFSRDLQDEFLKFKIENLKLILYIPRRGHANFILCQHCGEALKCPNCNVSLVLHRQPTTNSEQLICHHCGYSGALPKSCSVCKSYQLKPFGIGIERVESEIKKYYQRANLKMPTLFRLDSDSVKDERDEENIINDFLGAESAILLATQMIFSHKHRLANNLQIKPVIGIITADSLVNIPDYKTEESLFRQLILLAGFGKRLIIQTHDPENPAIKYFAGGDVSGFIKSELKNREELSYPPFSRFIKISFKHFDNFKAKREIAIVAEKLKQVLRGDISRFDIMGPSPAFISKEKNFYIWSLILRDKQMLELPLDSGAAEIKTRNELLRVVPGGRGWIIDIDPRTAI
jgi:primosomal protein N' (replication factor Y)